MHATEIVLTEITKDLLTEKSKGFYSTLIVLKLCSAFDTIDRSLLLESIELGPYVVFLLLL